METDLTDQEDLLDKITGGIRQEEFCRIFDLRKNLEQSDVLIKYTNNYLSLGWHLTAVNFHGQANSSLDFRQPEEIWSPKLVELSLDGVPVNLGVRTGSDSGLLVLEVPKQQKVFPFRRDDWCSGCVAEMGAEWEQHYYELPEGWQLPPSLILDPFQAKVFGEGGLVLAPPSVEPQGQAMVRWLRAPWEMAPSQLPPLLKKIIKLVVPEAESPSPGPVILSWEEIYPVIASHATVFQALLAPAPSPESYYQRLLEAAWTTGLNDSQLLLALLWHAPLGDARQRPQGLEYLQQLLNQTLLPADQRELDQPPAAGTSPQLQGISEERSAVSDFHNGFRVVVEDFSRRMSPHHPGMGSGWLGEQKKGAKSGPAKPFDGGVDFTDSWQELLRASQENLIVERHRYEAMIYELGKLEVWQEIYQKERQENQELKAKMETQWTRELDYLRKLLKKLP